LSKPRILYIGVESRGLSGCDYIEAIYNAFKGNNVGQRGKIRIKVIDTYVLIFYLFYIILL
jgi:hypothetical protein